MVAAQSAAVPAASAQPLSGRDRARELANTAADAIAHGEHERAEGLLRQAYAEYPAPTIALLHARTLVRLERLAAAANVYAAAALSKLDSDAPAVFRDAVEQAKREANELLPRVPRLKILLRGRPADLAAERVTLDDKELMLSDEGRWLLVDPGVRIVRVELAGAVDEQAVRVAERQSIIVQANSPHSAVPTERILSFSAFGLGALSVGAGVVTGLRASSAHRRAEADCPQNRCLEGSTGADELQRFKTYRAVSTAGYALGALSIGLGTFLFLDSRNSRGFEVQVDQQSASFRYRGTL